jgi:hypothetical protein
MASDQNLRIGLGSRKRLLAATVGSGALAVLALFGVAHTLPTASPNGVTADSGNETKFPGYSSPAVTAMNMGATTTTQPSDEPTALATSKAVPTVKAG